MITNNVVIFPTIFFPCTTIHVRKPLATSSPWWYGQRTKLTLWADQFLTKWLDTCRKTRTLIFLSRGRRHFREIDLRSNSHAVMIIGAQRITTREYECNRDSPTSSAVSSAKELISTIAKPPSPFCSPLSKINDGLSRRDGATRRGSGE